MDFESIEAIWDDPERRGSLWRQLTSPCDRWFFGAVKKAVEKGDGQILAQWLSDERYRTVLEFADNDPGFRPLAPFFRAHLHAGQAVLRQRASDHWVSDNTLDFLGQCARDIGVPVGLLRDLAEELAGREKRMPCRAVTVPFALVTTGQKATAVLAQFALELVPDGSGEIYLSPAQAFLRMDGHGLPGFHEAVFCAAWGAANQSVEGTGPAGHKYDVRVSVQPFDEQRRSSACGLFDPRGATGKDRWLTAELMDRSASGAAVWGLHFLLSGKIPDPGLITITQVDSAGSVSGLASAQNSESIQMMKAKVRKIAESRLFDKIIVAGPDDFKAASEEVESLSVVGAIVIEDLVVLHI